MTEDDAMFDLTSAKKKKKKKTPFDLDGAVEGAKEVGPTENVPENTVPKDEKGKTGPLKEDDEAEILDDLDLKNFGKKKKKKKTHDPLSVDELGEVVEKLSVDEEIGGKKRRNRVAEFSLDNEQDASEKVSESPWLDSDRDYTYDELLQRVFSIMKDKNPEAFTGDKKKLIMRPPQVVRVGTKKTAFVNFMEIAKMLHRQEKHLSDFLSAELGTVGAIDGNNQLIMKGRFQQKHIESVLRRYIKEYVTCHTCRALDTILNKEARLFFLQCMVCHSRCSVQTIKTGFQAVTGKRSAIRAKQ